MLPQTGRHMSVVLYVTRLPDESYIISTSSVQGILQGFKDVDGIATDLIMLLQKYRPSSLPRLASQPSRSEDPSSKRQIAAMTDVVGQWYILDRKLKEIVSSRGRLLCSILSPAAYARTLVFPPIPPSSSPYAPLPIAMQS